MSRLISRPRTHDKPFPKEWCGVIDNRFDERDLLSGVRGITQFSCKGYLPVSKYIHILFFIAFEKHTDYLLSSNVFEGESGARDPLVLETVYTLHSIITNLNQASFLADSIPCGQRTEDLLGYSDSASSKCVVAGSKSFMAERLEPFGGMVWGWILTPKPESKGDYVIEKGGWRILSWLVEIWQRDEEECQEQGSEMLEAQLGPTLSLTFPTIIFQLAFQAEGYAADPVTGPVRAILVAELLRLCGSIVEAKDLTDCLKSTLDDLPAKQRPETREWFSRLGLEPWLPPSRAKKVAPGGMVKREAPVRLANMSTSDLQDMLDLLK